MAHDHESIEYDLDEVKEVFDASVLTGIIVDVDIENDTADVNINGLGLINSVSIFYHCGGSSVIEDGSIAFSEGDSVYILNKNGILNPPVSDLRIVGFVDGPKSCGFRIKLTRGDGTLITKDSGLLTYIQLYNSDNVLLSITELIYTAIPETGEDVDGFWSFNLADSTDKDLDGYWVDYSCEDGIPTQYPYRYKSADKDKDVDLILTGRSYEDIIPYWKTSSYCRFDGVKWEVGDPLPFIGHGCPGFSFVERAESIVKVESSVEFQIHYVVKDLTALFQRYHTETGPYCDGGIWKVGTRSPDIPWIWGSKGAEATFSIVSTDGDGPITLKTETLDQDHIHPSNLESETEYCLDLDVTVAPGTMPFDTGNTGCSPPLKDFSANYIGTWINKIGTFSIMVVIAEYDY